jgi:DNA invertase Pin-like site-specific DNA recombinase
LSQNSKGRSELEKALDELGKGDIFVVAEWDRATPSMFDGIHFSRAGGLLLSFYRR